MKRMFAALLAALMLPACASAQIGMKALRHTQSGSVLAVFEVAEGSGLSDMVRMALDMQIEVRFAQKAARSVVERTGAKITQTGYLYQDESLASMARTWQGRQSDGGDGASAAALTVNLETGMEIYLDELFSDASGALLRMEEIVKRDILDNMNAYMENTDLLPIPKDCFFVDETGLTVFWPQERYSYFSGESGRVTFYWHELAEFIGEGSPVYALSRPQPADAAAVKSAVSFFGEEHPLALGVMLGGAMEAYALTDEPDYTASSVLYPLDVPQLRGVSVEIPKYAQTQAKDTPISALRHSRISWHGLVTGASTREDITALLGEPDAAAHYDEDAAYDALLAPGESLFYTLEKAVLEAHLDENGVLSCLILHSGAMEMPQ